MIHATVTLSNPIRPGTEAKIAAMRAYVGEDHYVATHQAQLDAAISDPEAPGYADDQADVANGICPRSLRSDDIHPNSAGLLLRSELRVARLRERGWV